METAIDGIFYNNATESLHSILNVFGVIQRIKIIIQRKCEKEI